MIGRASRWLLTVALVAGPVLADVETERRYLSGTGYGDAVEWEIVLTAGRRGGEWTTIPVPSQWELEGFGRYDYGHDENRGRDEGRYRHRFRVPGEWSGRRVELVFEGVMTDAEVKLNGGVAGAEHRGGFYRFRYDVSGLLRYGDDNLLEVRVKEHSADGSVNRAERQADYWVFGGIYRPVYLEASPVEGIARLAADARDDGTLTIEVFLRGRAGPGLDGPGRLEAAVETLGGAIVGRLPRVSVGAGGQRAEIAGTVAGALLWSAETPRLYRLRVELYRGGELLHRTSERIGFRSVEMRPGQGLFVNGSRVLLRGVNRHAFWPPSGRTLSPEIDRRDAELMKAMNLNAVRASHYPPDPSFLDACDELGIYVVDELAGWHDAYGTEVGRRLVAEMVTRDVNHPSIVFWANGNEGGWNRRLDREFRLHDPQNRPVIHPGGVAGGIDSRHYPTYSELADRLDPASPGNRWRDLLGDLPLVMPTEILHGLYDGGSGAGLEDTWRLLRASSRAAGAFLWSWSDESVVRTDRGGELDSDGNHAPDGVLGPYRERSGSFYAVRRVFSPIALAGEEIVDGKMRLENRFDRTDLARCRFHWALVDLPAPGEPFTVDVLAAGEREGPAAPPGASAELTLPLGDLGHADALRLNARDPEGREVAAWTLPARDLRGDLRALAAGGEGAVEVEESGGFLTWTAGGAGAELDLGSGELRALLGGGRRLDLRGPRPADGTIRPMEEVRRAVEGASRMLEARSGEGRSLRFAFYPSGWLRLEFREPPAGPRDFHGVVFPLPGEEILGLRWLGDGPARVWGNRRLGGTLGAWAKNAASSTPLHSAAEPKLEGFYAGVYWAAVQTPAGELFLAFESPGLYLGVGSPAFPADALNAVAAAVPPGIGLYRTIPAIGTKFKSAAELGPQSLPRELAGGFGGAVWLRLGAPEARR